MGKYSARSIRAAGNVLRVGGGNDHYAASTGYFVALSARVAGVVITRLERIVNPKSIFLRISCWCKNLARKKYSKKLRSKNYLTRSCLANRLRALFSSSALHLIRSSRDLP